MGRFRKQLANCNNIVNSISRPSANPPSTVSASTKVDEVLPPLEGPLLLGIETSGKSGSVALRSLEAVDRFRAVELPATKGSAQTLAPAIEKLLSDNHLQVSDISAMAVISGPGSFTGLRVGIATAKAFCYARKIPLVEIDAMDVLATQALSTIRQIEGGPSRFFTVMDAYRGQVFCAEYAINLNDDSVVVVQPTQIIDIERFVEPEIACRTTTSESRPMIYVGPGCDRLRKFLESDEVLTLLRAVDPRMAEIEADVVRKFIADMIELPITPQATTVSELAIAKLRSGETVDPFAISPKYYRSSAAEEKRGSVNL